MYPNPRPHPNPASAPASLKYVRLAHDISLSQLAEAAGMEMRDVYLVQIGAPTEPQDAARILDALSHMTGQTYSLTNVQVNVRTTRPQPISYPPLSRPFRLRKERRFGRITLRP